MCEQVRPRIRGRLTRQQEADGQMAAPAAPVKGGRKGGTASQEAAGAAQAADGTGHSAGRDPGAAKPGASATAGGKRKATATAALPGVPKKQKRPADDADPQDAAQPAAAERRSKGAKAAKQPATFTAAAAGAAGGPVQPHDGAEPDSDSGAEELASHAAEGERSFLEEVRLPCHMETLVTVGELPPQPLPSCRAAASVCLQRSSQQSARHKS